jgi:hypothetical protein
VLADDQKVFVYYAPLHLPLEPNGFYHYKTLQQPWYFAVVLYFTSFLEGPYGGQH